MKQCYILRMLVGVIGILIFPAMSLAGASEAGAGIRLRNAMIDTSAAAQQARLGALTARNKISAGSESIFAQYGDAERYLPFIIQFTGPIQQAWKQAVEQTGARLGGYLPDNAFIVELTSSQLSRVAALECVQWVGPFKPDYKIAPDLGRRFTAARTVAAGQALGADALSDETFTIQTFSSEPVPVVRDAVLGRNGRVLSVASSGRRGLLRVRMSVAGASELIDLPEVEFIEVYIAPQLHNNVAADSEHMNVQSLWINYNLTGSGQVVCVADTGLDSGNTNSIHPDFSNRVIAAIALGRPDSNDWADSTSDGGHGTHVAGSVLGSGAAWSNGLFRGTAYGASLVMQSVMDNDGGLGGIPLVLTNLFYQAYTNGARIHTDSWGSAVYGQYDIDSQSADQFMWDIRDMLVLFSAGNSGRDTNTNGVIDTTSCGSPGTAKNVLTVGAAESKRPAGSGGYSSDIWGSGSWLARYSADPIRNDLISTAFDTYQGMAAFSSRGPCRDGRFKPDIVAPGTDIISCRSRMRGAGTLWGTGEGVLGNAASNYYTFCGGTSMSTPLTAGAAALVRQYLREYHGLAGPSAALMKAIMVNGARSLTPGQYGWGQYREIPATRPNNVEGWGQVDLANTLFPSSGTTNAYYDVTNSADAMVTGGANLYSFVPSGTNRVSITLCWSDYPADLSASDQLVNDLDLMVITPDGVTNYPNGLTSADRLNNVEGVDLSSVTPGTIQIRVSGYNVPNGPQPYALVIHGSGYSAPVPPSLSTVVCADFDGDRKADPAVYTTNGNWKIKLSSGNWNVLVTLNAFLGDSGYSGLAADFDGDRKADPAIYNADSALWAVKLSKINYLAPTIIRSFGGSGWQAIAEDFDGDAKADPALYQAATGTWKVMLSTANYGTITLSNFLGETGWTAIAADFDGDGKVDPTIYNASTGSWVIMLSKAGYGRVAIAPGYLGSTGYTGLAADFDGDQLADPTVAQTSSGNWEIRLSNANYVKIPLPGFLGE